MASPENQDGKSGTGNGPKLTKTSLDKDLAKIVTFEQSTRSLSQKLFAPGLAFIFLGLAAAFASYLIGAQPNAALIIVAATIGGYMALNIGDKHRF